MLFAIPFTLVPLIVYDLIAWGLAGASAGDPWLSPLFTLEMPSGARFTPTSGDLMVVVAITFLFVEIVKATRTGNASLADHVLSMLVFVAYLVEFLIAAPAAHSVFAILTVIAFIDVVAGFTITIRGARRDVSWN